MLYALTCGSAFENLMCTTTCASMYVCMLNTDPGAIDTETCMLGVQTHEISFTNLLR